MEIMLQDGRTALFDDSDMELVQKHHWTSNPGGRTFYAFSVGAGTTMHRLILGASSGQLIDHKNRNGLDNRRANLRVCTHAQNIRNQRKRIATSSRFKGVRRDVVSGTWRVEIEQDGERLHLGTFRDEMRAARQYDRAAKIFFGQFAATNQSLGIL